MDALFDALRSIVREADHALTRSGVVPMRPRRSARSSPKPSSTGPRPAGTWSFSTSSRSRPALIHGRSCSGGRRQRLEAAGALRARARRRVMGPSPAKGTSHGSRGSRDAPRPLWTSLAAFEASGDRPYDSAEAAINRRNRGPLGHPQLSSSGPPLRSVSSPVQLQVPLVHMEIFHKLRASSGGPHLIPSKVESTASLPRLANFSHRTGLTSTRRADLREQETSAESRASRVAHGTSSESPGS